MSKAFVETIFPPKCLKCKRFLIADKSVGANRSYALHDIKNLEVLDNESVKSKPLNIRSVEAPPLAINDAYSNLLSYFCTTCFMQSRDLSFLRKCEKGFNIPFSSELSGVGGIASSTYMGMVKEAIHLLKYNGKTVLADPLGFLLFQTFVRYYYNRPVDFLVPIPLHRLKMMKRGFNQSFLLVRDFRKYWLEWKGLEPPWKVAPELLVRQRNTKSQTGFNRLQRQENIRGAFAVRKNQKIKDKHIVLVDDVHTTGTTTIEAAHAILEAGASSVGVLVVALT
ncbi:MAG: ComF family protein [Desulfamplus sp.]|nr:ComF family protein [Desulfamplus sp.]